MKKLFIMVCLLFASLAASANKIDDLKTDSDVVQFLISLNKKFTTGKYTPKLFIRPIDSIFTDTDCFKRDLLPKIQGAKSWQKVDLNNDKRTDLVVTVYWYNYTNYAVIDNGDGTYKLISLRYGLEFCELVNVIKHNNQNLIVFHGVDTDLPNRYFRPRTDTLIYKFGEFVEYNEKPVKYAIDSLILIDGYVKGNDCGSCPTFNMAVTKSGTINFSRYLYGGRTIKTDGGYRVLNPLIEIEPVSKSGFSTKKRKELFDLIKYIDLKKLKDRYNVPWTDAHTSTISVKFRDGTSKTIVDYGDYGTFGLHALFTKLYADFRANKTINVKNLIHQADSLNARSKHKKALKLYDQAINRITSYQDTIAKWEWFRICTAAGELSGKNYMKYSPAQYFVDGERYNEKIAALKQKGVNCIFTYNTNTIGGAGTSYIIDPKKKFYFLPSNKQKLLIWIANDNVYMQAFGDNIFKPLKMGNLQLADFLKTNYSELAHEELKHQRSRYDHRTVFVFKFYQGGTFYEKSIDQPSNLIDPKQNENTYLNKLLPLVQAEAREYYATLKPE